MEGARRKKFQKEDGGRKYFVQATNGCQKGQTEKKTKKDGGQMKFKQDRARNETVKRREDKKD
jgi:hypothetical protein